MPDRFPTLPWKFILLATAFFLITFALETYNHRFWLNDYRVYYSAAQALRSGQEVYSQAYGLGTGFYKYSPCILLFFLPFSFLPFGTAAIIHFWVVASASLMAMLLTLKLLKTNLVPEAGRHENLLLSATFIILGLHLVRELHLGNVNMIIILLLLMALQNVLTGRQTLGGILFGIAVLFKPYMLLLALPFWFHRKYRTIGSFVITIAASFLLLLPVAGVGGTLSLHREWFHAMAAHVEYLGSHQTLEALTGHFLRTPLPFLRYLFPLLAVLLYTLFFAMGSRKHRGDMPVSYLIMGYFLLLALLPNLLITDTEHFLFSMPVLLYINASLFIRRSLPLTVFALLFFICYAGTSTDLMGSEVAGWLDRAGMIGLGNLGLIGMATVFFLGKQQP
jgi:hypothetical protein